MENLKLDTTVSHNIQDGIGRGHKEKEEMGDNTNSKNIQDSILEGYKEEEIAGKTDSEFETKTLNGPFLEEIKENLTAHVHQPEEPDTLTGSNGECPTVAKSELEINAALPNDTFPNSSSEARDPQKETEVFDDKSFEDGTSLPADRPQSESNIENGPVIGDSMLSCVLSKANSEYESTLQLFDYKGKHCTLQGEDLHVQTKVTSEDPDCLHSPCTAADMKSESAAEDSSIICSRDMIADVSVACGTEDSDSFNVNSEVVLDMSREIEDVKNPQDKLSGAEGRSDENILSQENEDAEYSLSNQTSTVSPKSAIADVITVEAAMTLEAVPKQFNFLIRIPRFNDDKLREQIMQAQLQVEEKTKLRDAIRHQIQKKKATCQTYGSEYEAAKIEDKTARKLVRSKRLEIDSLHSIINKAKNAISIEDIDTRIHNVEHVLQHETLPLKEEKQFIYEIKQLKQLREQLSSNMGSQDEIQEALDQREEVEERLKGLKKELDNLKSNAIKAEAAAMAAGKKYEDQHKKVMELQDQLRAAAEVRQEAYAQLLSLKKEYFDKNKHFRIYKDAAAAASDYAFRKNKEALRSHCINQVEKVMELWNANRDFREEYVKYNARSTLRRLGTFDGRSLGPDEEPQCLPFYVERRVDNLVSTSAVSDSVSQRPVLELNKKETGVENVIIVDKYKKEVVERKKSALEPREPAKSSVEYGLETNSGWELTVETEEEPVKSKEELELEKKAEESRKMEAEAKFREQRRLEEMTKAKEALERKKRNAEKAQMRAELRAQKEVEQREKEKEKRLRKKERKKASGTEVTENNGCETDQSSENVAETIKEAEVKENASSSSVTKRPSKPQQFTKTKSSVPAALRNKNRRKLQQWIWLGLTSFAVIILFLLGNLGAFQNLNLRRQGLVV